MALQTPIVTQAEIAQAIGVSPSTVSRMLSGKLSIATEHLEAMCKTLRLDLLEVTREAMALAAEESKRAILDGSTTRQSRTIAAHSRPGHEPSRSRVPGASRTRRRDS